ncbi:MAG: dockerin type I domain-containing protein [Nanoarchaeota archaeon]
MADENNQIVLYGILALVLITAASLITNLHLSELVPNLGLTGLATVNYGIRTCDDFDNGKNYNIASYVKYSSGSTSYPPKYDTCSGNNVIEYYCSATGYPLSLSHYCTGGCSEGACKNRPTTTSCVDTEKAPDSLTKGTVTYTSATGTKSTYTDFCLSGYVIEYYCKSTTEPAKVQIPCEAGYSCVDGACINAICGNGLCELGEKGVCFVDCPSAPTPICGNNKCEIGEDSTCAVCKEGEPCQGVPCSVGTCPTDCSLNCIDTDNGRDYFVRGVVTGYDKPTGEYAKIVDNCEGPNGLNEYICDGKYGMETEYVCPNGCVDGACISLASTCGDTICSNTEINTCAADCGLPTDPTKSVQCGSYGDVNLDGKISKIDSDLILKYDVALIKLNEKQLLNADVNGDKLVNVVDAQNVLAYLQGTLSLFKVCQAATTETITTAQNSISATDGSTDCGSKGDVDLDGTITSKDSLLILKYVAGTAGVTLNPTQMFNAEVTGEGNVDSTDASQILRYIAGLIQTFKACTMTYSSCNDNDPSNNIFLTGRAVVTDSYQKLITLADHCNTGATNGVYQYACKQSGTGFILDKSLVSCPAGYNCADGACKILNSKNCVDYDSGLMVYIKSYVSYTKDNIDKKEYDICASSTTVIEQLCSLGEVKTMQFECNLGYSCVDGSCKQVTATSTTSSLQTEPSLATATTGLTDTTNTCIDSAPSGLTLQPPSGTVIPTGDVKVSWTLASWGNNCKNTGKNFTLQISKGNTFSFITAETLDSSRYYYTFSGLTAGSTYYWRIIANNGFMKLVSGYKSFIIKSTVCGNGIIESGEQCDGGACCSAFCTFRIAGTVCRASTAACDPTEACAGSSAACPSDINTCRSATCGNAICEPGEKEVCTVCPDPTDPTCTTSCTPGSCLKDCETSTGLKSPCGSLGDVDLDGFVTSKDSLLVLNYVAGKAPLSAQQKINADVASPAGVDSTDASQILRFVSGLIQRFQNCPPVITNCVDNDPSQNIYVRGSLVSTDTNGASKTWSDFCGTTNLPGLIIVPGNLYQYNCKTISKLPTVYSIDSTSVKCPTGYSCSNGACNPTSTTQTPLTGNIVMQPDGSSTVKVIFNGNPFPEGNNNPINGFLTLAGYKPSEYPSIFGLKYTDMLAGYDLIDVNLDDNTYSYAIILKPGMNKEELLAGFASDPNVYNLG